MSRLGIDVDSYINKALDKLIEDRIIPSKQALLSELLEDYLMSVWNKNLIAQRDEIKYFAEQMRTGNIPQQLQNVFRFYEAGTEKGRMRVINRLIGHHNELEKLIDDLNAIKSINVKEKEAAKPPVNDILKSIDDLID